MSRPTSHRATLGAYIGAGRHMLSETRVKPIKQVAAETGMSRDTVRYWLKADHYDEWLQCWPSVEALWAEWHKDKPSAVPAFFDDLPDLDPAAIAAADDMR